MSATLAGRVSLELCNDCLLWMAGYSEHELGRAPSVPNSVRESVQRDVIAEYAGKSWSLDMSNLDTYFAWQDCQLCGDIAGDRITVTAYIWH